MKTVLFLFASVLLCTLVATSEPRKCFACNWLQPGCEDPFNNKTQKIDITPCKSDKEACSKFTITVGNGTNYIARTCGGLTSNSVGRSTGHELDGSIVTTFSNYCYSDLCNGATTMSVSVTTLLVLGAQLIFRTSV